MPERKLDHNFEDKEILGETMCKVQAKNRLSKGLDVDIERVNRLVA